MTHNSPLPTKTSVLSRLKANIPITAIVDVGVREHTGELIDRFSDKKHYLFEPVTLFFDSIARHYRDINHELFPVALSDSSSQLFLVLTALQKDGVVTHSQIKDAPIEPDGKHVVSCHPVDVRRFDDLDVSTSIDENFLLKVDVDGKDLEVLSGFGDQLKRASAVIVECPYHSAVERLSFLKSKGFSLLDMVDLVYYGDALYQFDAVMIREELVTPALRPPIDRFEPGYWRELSFSNIEPSLGRELSFRRRFRRLRGIFGRKAA